MSIVGINDELDVLNKLVDEGSSGEDVEAFKEDLKLDLGEIE